MRLAHGLLHLQGIGIDDEAGAHSDAQDLPAFLEDMREGQEIEHAVLVAHRHALVVGLHRGMILPTGEDHALRVARGAAGIEDVGDVVHRGLPAKVVDLALTGESLAQLQEVGEVDAGSVTLGDDDGGVEDDDALERVTGGEDTPCLVVLCLLAHEDEADVCIIDDELYLLFRARGIEGDGDSTDAPGPEVGEEIVDGVLREHAYILLYSHAHVEQSV